MKNTTKLPANLQNAQPSAWLADAKERIENRDWQDLSFEIALRVYDKIKSDKNLSQKWLADELKVSSQYVNKILKGKENLTLQTITKLENALGLRLISLTEEKVELNTELASKKVLPFGELTVTVNNVAQVTGESIVEYETFSESA